MNGRIIKNDCINVVLIVSFDVRFLFKRSNKNTDKRAIGILSKAKIITPNTSFVPALSPTINSHSLK